MMFVAPLEIGDYMVKMKFPIGILKRKQMQKYSWMSLLGLNLVIMSLSDPLFAQTNHKVIASLDFSAKGRQKILESAFANSKSKLENYLKNFTIPDKVLGPDPKNCTVEKMTNMSIADKWYYCAGIPVYFFKDGYSWIPKVSHFEPRPVQTIVQNSRIEDIEFANAKVSCTKGDCLITLPIKRMTLKADIDLKTINATETLAAGENILSFHPVKFHIDNSLESHFPSLQLKVSLYAKDNEELIWQFDTSQAAITVPPGSIRLELPDKQQDLAIEKVFNGPEKLNLGNTSFKVLKTFAGPFIGNFSEYIDLLDLNKSINQHFEDDLKMVTVNNLVNSRVLIPLLNDLNMAVMSSPIFLGKVVKVPGLGLQDIINYQGQKKIKEIYHDFLKNYLKEVSLGKIPLEDEALSSFKIHGKDLSNLLLPFAKSVNPQTAALLNELAVEAEGIRKKLLGIDTTNRPGSSAIVNNEIKTLDETVKFLLNMQEKIITNIATKEESIHLKAVVQKLDAIDNLVRIQLVDTKCLVIDDESEMVEKEKEQDNYDLRAEINFATLNSQLNKAQKSGKFDFCLHENELLTCDETEVSSSLQKTVKVVRPPQILWDEEGQRHYFQIGLSIGQNGDSQKGLNLSEAQMKVFFKARLCEDGMICFDSSIQVEKGVMKDPEIYKLAAKNILEYGVMMNPVLKDYASPDLAKDWSLTALEQGVNEFNFTQKFPVPWPQIQSIQHDSQGIKIYGLYPKD